MGTYLNKILSAPELYNDSIGTEAVSRGGNNPQLKGTIHEMLYRDKLNLNLNNIRNGDTTVLTMGGILNLAHNKTYSEHIF